jgi:hypothetical protein
MRDCLMSDSKASCTRNIVICQWLDKVAGECRWDYIGLTRFMLNIRERNEWNKVQFSDSILNSSEEIWESRSWEKAMWDHEFYFESVELAMPATHPREENY